MTGSGRDEPSRQWAARELGVSPDASADEVRAAFLRRLPREDFVPQSSLWGAARCLGVGSDGTSVNARTEAEVTRAREEALRAEVEDFANSYWTTPPAQRRARWEALSDRASSFLALRARLNCLAGGLGVASPELPAGTDPAIADLARRICDLYVLRLAARARSWQGQWREMRWRIWDWKSAAAKLREYHPDIARLMPDVVDKLAGWEGPTRYDPPPVKPLEAAEPNWRRYRWLLWVAALGVSALVRTFDRSSPTSLEPPQPVPSAQQLNQKLPLKHSVKDGSFTGRSPHRPPATAPSGKSP